MDYFESSVIKYFMEKRAKKQALNLSLKAISPKEQWKRLPELHILASNAELLNCTSKILMLEAFVDMRMSIDESIAFLSHYETMPPNKDSIKMLVIEFFSGKVQLKCAVNPTISCNDCKEFKPKDQE
jgi:hypothetical protein